MYRITNTSKGPRGIWSGGRLVWLEPGASKTFAPDNSDAVLHNSDFEVEPIGEVPEIPAALAKKAAEPAKAEPAKKPAPAKRKTRRKKASK
jgi:hypothetical protein